MGDRLSLFVQVNAPTPFGAVSGLRPPAGCFYAIQLPSRMLRNSKRCVFESGPGVLQWADFVGPLEIPQSSVDSYRHWIGIPTNCPR